MRMHTSLVPALLTLLYLPGVYSDARIRQKRQDSERLQLPEGWSSVFYEDFSDVTPGSLPSSSRWNILTGTSYPAGDPNWGNHEVQTYSSSTANVVITDEKTLSITPRKDGDTWTSARIESVGDYGCLSGQMLRIEASIKLGDAAPDQQIGIWPAFWIMGSLHRHEPQKYKNWPQVGEVDIMETVSGLSDNLAAVHCGKARVKPPCEPAKFTITPGVSRGQWHKYTYEIDRRNPTNESMSWYIDGVVRHTLSQSRFTGKEAEDAWKALVGNQKYLILNIAVGGELPDLVQLVGTLKDLLSNGAPDGFHDEPYNHVTPNEKTIDGIDAGMEVRYVSVSRSS